MVSSVLLRPGQQLSPGPYPYSRSGRWKVSKQVFPGLYAEAGGEEERGKGKVAQSFVLPGWLAITRKDLGSSSSKRKPQTLTKVKSKSWHPTEVQFGTAGLTLVSSSNYLPTTNPDSSDHLPVDTLCNKLPHHPWFQWRTDNIFTFLTFF